MTKKQPESLFILISLLYYSDAGGGQQLRKVGDIVIVSDTSRVVDALKGEGVVETVLGD